VIGGWCLVLLVLCITLHGETYRIRPPAGGLTKFYLCVSLGGVLGGFFVAVLSPLLFPMHLELHLALVATAVLLLACLWTDVSGPFYRGGLTPLWGVFALLVSALVISLGWDIALRLQDKVLVTRSFHGTYAVYEPPREPGVPWYRELRSGTTIHGVQYFLCGEAVLLELALQRLALDLLLEEGFRIYTTPDLARRRIVDAMAFSPRGPETQIYSVEGTDLDLIGTAEITLGGLYEDTVLDEDDLPIKIGGISHCYRTEAGSAGRESKGLYRVHQFTKVEMFTFTRPEDSDALHAELPRIEERLYGALDVPYRVIDIATGDLGAPAYRKFDIEAWIPGRGDGGDYGEVTSTSNCTDFQARRLKTRFRRKGTKKNELVHTLNGTAVAISRALITLLENHQQADGSISIPEKLRPYTGFDRIGPR
jgi:hypothetical protein